jgi:hypothetical protein
MPKSSDASLTEVKLILLHTSQTCVSLKSYTCCDTGRIMGSSWIVWRHNRWNLLILCCLSVADIIWKTIAESISYQPWSARYDTVSSMQSRPVHKSLCITICRMYVTILLDRYTSFTYAICGRPEISVVKLSLEPNCRIKCDTWLTRCLLRHPKGITCY